MRLGDRHQAHPRRLVQTRGSLPAHNFNDTVLPQPAQDLAAGLRRAAQQPGNRCRRAPPAGVHGARAQLQPAPLSRGQHHQQQPQPVRRRTPPGTTGQHPGRHRILALRRPSRPEQDLAQAQQHREFLPRQRQGMPPVPRLLGPVHRHNPAVETGGMTLFVRHHVRVEHLRLPQPRKHGVRHGRPRHPQPPPELHRPDRRVEVPPGVRLRQQHHGAQAHRIQGARQSRITDKSTDGTQQTIAHRLGQLKGIADLEVRDRSGLRGTAPRTKPPRHRNVRRRRPSPRAVGRPGGNGSMRKWRRRRGGSRLMAWERVVGQS